MSIRHCHPGGPRRFWADGQRIGFVPGHSVKAVDSTAAGDAFSGGLACAWPAASPWRRPCVMPAWSVPCR